tara:strand:+ start:647 stop:835 length:189 start_codon:yes stop_codon:yes gene_type:complete
MKVDDNWKRFKIGDLVSCLTTGTQLRTGVIVKSPNPYKEEFEILFTSGDKKKVCAEYVKKIG